MAFCRNCGSEVLDNAYVCTKCGSLINQNSKKKVIDPKNEGLLEFHQTLSFWLLFIAGIFTILSVLFFNLSFAYYYTIYNVFHLNYDMSVLAFISSFLVLILCVLSYSLSFKLVRQSVISKSTNHFLLLAMISSLIYFIAKLFMIG